MKTQTVKALPEKPSSPIWAPVRPITAASRIVTQFREALFAGRLRPGDYIGSEMELASQFGVSRLTIRDALRTLEATGIVEIRVGAAGGARIAPGKPELFADALAIQFKLADVAEDEILDAQLAVECMTAELAAQRATDSDLVRLEELLDEAGALVDSPREFTESSMHFHVAVAEATHNRALVVQLRALRHVVWRPHAPRTTYEIAQRVLRDHWRLYELIKSGDFQGARLAMAGHIEEIRVNTVKKSPQ